MQNRLSDLTDDDLKTIIDNPEMLIGTVLDGFGGTREITDTVDVELGPFVPARAFGVESAAGVVVEDDPLGVGMMTNDKGQVKVVDLLKKIDDEDVADVEVDEWSDDVAELADN